MLHSSCFLSSRLPASPSTSLSLRLSSIPLLCSFCYFSVSTPSLPPFSSSCVFFSGPDPSVLIMSLAPTSVFPPRGQAEQDREFRHPRVRSERSRKRDTGRSARESLEDLMNLSLSTTSGLAAKFNERALLPPLPRVIDAIIKLISSHFQLGFLPKRLFPERLRINPESVSPFFLLSALSISARLTPAFAEQYGGPMKAAELFMECASAVAQREMFKEPSLERCQAFYLLSVSQQGSSLRNKSSVKSPSVVSACPARPLVSNTPQGPLGRCNADGDPVGVAQGRNLCAGESHQGTHRPG